MANPGRPVGRRAVMKFLVSQAATVVCPPLFSASHDLYGKGLTSPSQDAERKFNPDGTTRPFAGNTVICPLSHDSALYALLRQVRSKWQTHRFAGKIAFVPPLSYHMTVFSGANDQDRKPGRWPAGIPLDASMNECNKIVENRLKAATFPLALPLRFVIDDDPANQVTGGSGIRLLPFDKRESDKVRQLRDKLSDVIQIRTPDHDQYGFHITLGYRVQPFSSMEDGDYTKTLSEAVATLVREVRSIDFHVPVYCTFTDMLAYYPRFKLKV